MRIGIDASAWTNWRGFGRFTRSIIQALVAIDRVNEYGLIFDTTYPQCAAVPTGARHLVVGTVAAQTDAISVDGRRSAGDIMKMSMSASREHFHVFFYPSIDSFFPVFGSNRVVMIHDVIPEQIGDIMLPDKASQMRRRLKVKAAIMQSHLVATGSARVRSQIAQVFALDPERIVVIPYGVAAYFSPPDSLEAVTRHVFRSHGIRPPYLLHVGGFGPNKNIPRLLESFAAIASRAEFRDVTLVFVGKRDADAVYSEAAQIDALLARPDINPRIRMLGFQPEEELLALYQAATALVLPSLAEGFGLPALEAVSCGVPAVVTTESPLPAVLGDAAFKVDPLDLAGLQRALELALTDDDARTRAKAKTGLFGWDVSARAALSAFQRVVKRSK